MTLIVGQKLWYVPSYGYRRDGHEVTVEKIGRRWVTLAGNCGRIDKGTLFLDGGQYTSPGRCWLSREAYEESKAIEAANVGGYRSGLHTVRVEPGVTLADIQAAAALLRVDISEKEPAQ